MESPIGELLSLDGKIALVTGGATGIGEGIVRVLAAAGAHVWIGDIDIDGAKRVATEVGGAHATATRLDVTDPDDCAALMATMAEHGGVDVLVNNAGSYREAGSILDQSHESWHRSIDVNLVSLFNCSKPAAARMVEQARGGSIINIASVDGTLPCLGTGYDTAKGGAIQFSRSLAVDLAPHNIRVNAVSPGNIPVPTLQKIHSGELPPLWPVNSSTTGLMGPMMKSRSKNIPLGRLGTPADIARAVLFFATEASAYVTGQNLNVDGGWTLI